MRWMQWLVHWGIGGPFLFLDDAADDKKESEAEEEDAGVVSSLTMTIGCDGSPKSISVEYNVDDSVGARMGLGGLMAMFDGGWAQRVVHCSRHLNLMTTGCKTSSISSCWSSPRRLLARFLWNRTSFSKICMVC